MTRNEATALINENPRYTLKKERDVQLKALMATHAGAFRQQEIILGGVIPKNAPKKSYAKDFLQILTESWVRAGGHVRRCLTTRDLLLVAGKPPREGVLDCFRGGFCYEY